MNQLAALVALDLGAIMVMATATGCAHTPVPYVSLSGTIAMPASVGLDLTGAPIDILSLAGDLARLSATTARQTGVATPTEPAQGEYSVEIDARTLPATPTLFVVQLANPAPGPASGPILEALVALSRPEGAGPDLGSVVADLDATSSLAAMAIQYRQSLTPDLATADLSPTAIASYLGNRTSLPFDLATALVTFTDGQSTTAPCASTAIAQEASQALPQDLTTVR